MQLNRYSPFIPTQDDIPDFDRRVFEQLTSEPLDNIFNLNLYELRQNCQQIDFNSSRYDMRPDLVSWDYYQSIAMSNVILLVNNCPTTLNFTRENLGAKIYVPNKLYVQRLLNSTL